MRGDRPVLTSLYISPISFTPHARGSTPCRCRLEKPFWVYPACAGIDPISPKGFCCEPGLPRMRGDRPLEEGSEHGYTLFTPHARGSTVFSCSVIDRIRVYPACAGIDPITTGEKWEVKGLPRMRGDRPFCVKLLDNFFVFTPHARGSTSDKCFAVLRGQVYPACAGIDLSLPPMIAVRTRLPRMRGDRPRSQRI